MTFNITYDYLFNELNEEDYYEPKEIGGVFDGSYTLYESKGNKLALWEYFIASVLMFLKYISLITSMFGHVYY